jgi:hypothetical protein
MIDPEFASAAEWARLYRTKAIQVVPARSHVEVKPGQAWKCPLLQSWTEFQEALVPDDKFDEWYGPHGQYIARLQMGTICGRASGGMFVIDLDTYKNPAAAAWWQGLLAVHNNGMPLETPEQRTGGGGLQKLFRAPPGWTPPTCKTPIGIDIRGQGGFAMLAPSMHESGRAYEWLDGLSPDEVEIAVAPDWLIAAIDALVLAHGGSATSGQTKSSAPKTANTFSSGTYDGFGHQTDGREEYMRDMVWRVVTDWHRECPIKPSEAESHARMVEEYGIYEQKMGPRGTHDPSLTKTQKMEAEGRGPSLFHVKWRAAMKLWDTKVAEAAKQPGKSYGENPAKSESILHTPPPGQTYPYLDIDQILAMPDPVWAIENLIAERALGFIFGPPGSLKTFLALDMALTMATSIPHWWGRKVNSRGAVIYLCREGTRSLKFRLKAWQAHRQCQIAGRPFFLIEAPINFMRGEDVALLIATVEAIMTRVGVPVAAVFVDTVSRVLPGAKENQQEDMSLFVGACELLQSRIQCLVIGVHHTNKNGGIRGSTVIPGAGDFLIETRREPGAMTGSIVLQKVKDGEDGQEFPFKVTKVTLGDIGGNTSLMLDPDGVAKAAAAPGGDLPDITVCREILGALAQAWFNKMPWSKSANSDRPALVMIMNRWMLKREVAKRLMDGWLANGIIEIEIFDKKNKLSGYRKITDL